jgi:hypothetical protein
MRSQGWAHSARKKKPVVTGGRREGEYLRRCNPQTASGTCRFCRQGCSGAVPHHGPVSPGCRIECLLTVLSYESFNPLARAYDVISLYRSGQLRQIHGLGRRRISEIETALVYAGLVTPASNPRSPKSAPTERGKAAE